MFNTTHSLACISSDHLSIEAISDGFSCTPNQSNLVDDLDINSLFDPNELFDDLNVVGTCYSSDFINCINSSAESHEFDQYFSYQPEPSKFTDIDPNQLALNDLLTCPIGKKKTTKSNKKPIPLSSSVGIGAPLRVANLSRKIEIVNELEGQYRPRYKTDYFSLNGTKRKPRYVTDRHGNHYITLRVPKGIQGKIRIDWLTIPDENGDRYVMPYRFQTNNDLIDAEDCNPTYVDIHPDPSSSLLKLYLVLIKAKQDALKSLQPLQPFHPYQDIFGVNEKQTLDKTMQISPKKLIQKYQLGKSQLAFTLCTLSVDGQIYVPEWDTTAYSTVLEEESIENITTNKIITCPSCSTELDVSDDGIVLLQTGITKRKSLPIVAEKKRNIKKQKSINDSMIILD